MTLLAVVAVGLVIRCVFVDHPFDARTMMAWREADYVQLARNFLREDWSLFHPRVDWRGETSGLAEVELPLIPWIGSLLYRVFGYHEEILRVLSAALSCGALLAFSRIGRRLLAPAGALAAVALYAVNPLLFGIGGGIQPEPLLLVLTVLAADALLRYADESTPGRLLVACAWLAAAMLAKSPAVHLGFLTAFLVLRREGRVAFRSWHVYAGAALAVLPPLAWYVWAHGHYADTGLSFGVSNETHLISAEMILHPGTWLRGNFRAELRDVLGFVGVLLVLAALLRRGRAREFAAAWYASILILYVIVADTSGDEWAFYYHANSVAPAALLMGAGVDALRSFRPRAVRLAAPALAVLACIALGRESWEAHRLRNDRPDLEAFHAACLEFADQLPPDARIAVRGGYRMDAHGHPVAFNASMAYAWLDRKGLNYPIEDATTASILSLAERGCTHWIVQPADLDDARLLAFARDADTTVVSEAHGHLLIDLRSEDDRVPLR